MTTSDKPVSDWCAPCRAILLAAAETGDPYDLDRLCASCRKIVLSPLKKGSYDWLTEIPQWKQWAIEQDARNYELESRALAVDRIAEEFPGLVVKHVRGRLVVMKERLYGKPSVNTVVFRTVGGGPLAQSQQRVEINAEPVPGGWAYARSPQDLMRA